ncbi:DUF4243 domain-containing protein [Streptomyces sp. NA04227]|uniref:questin oxidase family protein n=1 Tax=Streptomyces sp. NA04227 TaxID=2742136 RepID=UPI0015911678|nr:questin oxidase family protein [Streptomyces sp. NA04227]QKW07505.1 DUF4243 domain-containing protein [Streptomyces sp. NA04227]
MDANNSAEISTDRDVSGATDRDASGVLDEALGRLHATGPEFDDWLTNHGPMAVEAMVRYGAGGEVHRWLDRYAGRLETAPAAGDRITEDSWREAMGDPRRLGDWLAYFERLLVGDPRRPWRAELAEWWPRLLPGIAGGSTHPVIRVGHVVRVLREGGEPGGGGPGTVAAEETLLRELAHGLGYWAARYAPLPSDLFTRPAPRDAAQALLAVAPVPDQSRGMRHRLDQLAELPDWTGELSRTDAALDQVPAHLDALVDSATRYYATHAHGSPVMLVHAATAPNAVARVLPELPRSLWVPSLAAAWSASAAVTAAYRPAGPAEVPDVGTATPEELFARAAAHGDEHAIKLADTVVDTLRRHPGDAEARGAVLRAVELIEPLGG